MNKLKVMVWLFASVFTVNSVLAQNIDEGRRFLYYEKYKSAAGFFQNLVNSNPNNVEAVYWLGQSWLRNDDEGVDSAANVATAKALYQKTLLNNSNSALLTVGMGHIELLEGKTADARNRFETAISISKGKDIPVLNAIGYANVDAKAGDAQYAIDKLKLAATLKLKDPDVYLNLGDAYRKLDNDGSNPLRAYQSALELDPNNARALYRIGKIYQSQGIQQEDLYMKYYNDAIAKDAAFGPVYFNLYRYYTDTKINVNKAAENLDKYLSNTDDPNSPTKCYYRASMLFQQGKFTDVITKADECIQLGGNDPYVKIYALKGYAYMRIPDSMKAKSMFDSYFKKQKSELITGKDVATYVTLLLRTPGSDTTIIPGLISRALQMDTTDGRIELLKMMANRSESAKMYKDAGDWYKKILDVKKNPTNVDMFNAGYNYYKAGDFTNAVAMFEIYTTKYPEDIQAWDLKGRSQRGIDSTLQNGLANESFQKVIDLGEAKWATDSVRVKSSLLRAYKYFIEYSYNVKKDKTAAVMYCDKVLAKDPNDEEVKRFKTAFSAPATPVRPPAARPGSKPAGGTQPAGGTPKTPAPKKK